MKFRPIIASFYLLLQLSVSIHAQIPTISPVSPPVLGKGIVIETVLKNSQAQRAGIQPGDVLLSWERGTVKDEFSSPFDLSYIFLDQAPRGLVTVNAVRGNSHKRWSFRSEAWGLSVRPNFTERLLTMYRDGEQAIAAARYTEAVGHFRAAADIARQGNTQWLAPWLLSHAGKSLSGFQQWNVVDALYAEAIEQASGAGPIVRSALFRQWAVALESRDDFLRAGKSYQAALAEYQKLGSKTLAGSNTLLSLSVVELKGGRFDEAEEHLHQALSIAKNLAPSSIQTLLIVSNLAVLYHDQGDFENAERYYFKALDEEEKHFPNSIQLAETLQDVGVLFDQEGDLRRAEAYQRRGLVIAQKLNPESLDVSAILSSLANCLLEEGDPAKAELYQGRALAIRERIAPGGLPSGYDLAGLGKIARVRGHFTSAEDYYNKALAIVQKADASDLDRARFLLGLAAVMRDQRKFLAAQDLYRQALAIIEKKDPTSIDRADTLGDLAGVFYRAGQPDAASQLYKQALDILERRAEHLGGIAEARSLYGAEHVHYYQEFMELLLAQGHPEQAFEILEASRARALLAMLAKARIDMDRNVDAGLRQRERKLQRELNEKSEYRIRLAGNPHSDQQLTDLDDEIANLLLQYQQTDAELRLNNPSYAAIVKPPKLRLREIQNLLDSGTLLLEYSLGEEHSYLWVVTPDLLKAYVLPKREDIEKAARHVYSLLIDRDHNTSKHIDSGETDPDYLHAAKTLSHMILAPAGPMLRGKRLLIVADGALQYIPFSALPFPGTGGSAVPLVVTHEIVNLPSASVLAELRSQRMHSPKAPNTVLVVADPVFDAKDERIRNGEQKQTASDHAAQLNNVDMTRANTSGAYLSRLLYSRNEAEAVMAQTPPGKGLLVLDFAANRSFATSQILAKYRIIHFATHGILNSKHPELSGLVLSLFNRQGQPQDGFLKLQDIYNLKLSAELVVLSGCETGLGEKVNGEGLIGLARGFMYAGASRVVASLWSVSDMATATLMANFYRAMEHDGMRPTAALRVAQVQMWRRKQWSSPYYWAAFQIQGDWQ